MRMLLMAYTLSINLACVVWLLTNLAINVCSSGATGTSGAALSSSGKRHKRKNTHAAASEIVVPWNAIEDQLLLDLVHRYVSTECASLSLCQSVSLSVCLSVCC
jgi:hypothetical protein